MSEDTAFVSKLGAASIFSGFIVLVLSGNPIPLLASLVAVWWLAQLVSGPDQAANQDAQRTYEERADAALAAQIKRRQRSREHMRRNGNS